MVFINCSYESKDKWSRDFKDSVCGPLCLRHDRRQNLFCLSAVFTIPPTQPTEQLLGRQGEFSSQRSK